VEDRVSNVERIEKEISRLKRDGMMVVAFPATTMHSWMCAVRDVCSSSAAGMEENLSVSKTGNFAVVRTWIGPSLLS
jgi:hypothetical protein